MDNRELQYQIEAIKVYSQIETIYRQQSIKNPNCHPKNMSLIRELGLDVKDLLPAFISFFYEKGKEDALKELKESL